MNYRDIIIKSHIGTGNGDIRLPKSLPDSTARWNTSFITDPRVPTEE